MWFRDLISNQFLLTGISSWLWAQVLKTIIHALVTHRLDLSRLVIFYAVYLAYQHQRTCHLLNGSVFLWH